MADILNVEQYQTVEEFKQNLEEMLPDVCIQLRVCVPVCI